MNNDLEQTLEGYERLALTDEQIRFTREHFWEGLRKKYLGEEVRYGAIRPDLALFLIKSLVERNIGEIRIVSASEFPCPDELQAFLEKHHPGEFEKYWTGSTDDTTLHDECKIDRVEDYKQRYFIFIRKIGNLETQ